MPILDDILKEGDAERVATPAPSASRAPKSTAAPRLDDLLAEGDREGTAPRPAAAPPVLPAVTAATPGATTPPPAIPATPTPSAPNPALFTGFQPQVAPGYLDLNAQNTAANPALKKTKPTAADVQTMVGEVGRDVAALPAGQAPPSYTPVRYGLTPGEQQLHQVNQKIAALPASIRPLPGPIKGPKTAEYGPVAGLQADRRVALASVGQQLPQMVQSLQQSEQEIARRWKEWNDYSQFNQGLLSPAQAAAAKKAFAQLKQDTAAVEQRRQYLNGLATQVEALHRSYASKPIHTGMYYPEEFLQREQEAPQTEATKKLGGAAQFALALNPYGAMLGGVNPDTYVQAISQKMLTGEYPPSVPLPQGLKPVQKQGLIDQKNQLIQVVLALGNGLESMGRGNALQPNGTILQDAHHQIPLTTASPSSLSPSEAMKVVRNLTPWQKKILPNLLQQMKADQEARDATFGRQIGLGVATAPAAVIAGGAAHSAAEAALGRLLGPAVEDSLAAVLAREGVPAALRRAALQGVAQVGAGAAGGAGAGAVLGATSGLLNREGPIGVLKEAGAGALGGAKVGAGLSGLWFLKGAAGAAMARGWDPETSPRVVERVSSQVAERLGLTPEEQADLKTRLTELGQAPAHEKYALGKKLSEDLKFRAAQPAQTVTRPAITAEAAPTPPAPAPRTPTPAPEEVVIPGEKPVHTPTGAAPGFIGPRIKTPAGEVPLRTLSPDELQTTRAAAEAAGDTQTVARADQALQAHDQYNRVMREPPPMEEAPDYLKERNKTGNPAVAHARVLRTTAQAVAADNPELAQKLGGAADQYEMEFKHQWLTANGKTVLPESPGPPPSVSAWRKLTPPEMDALPAAAKKALLVQDIQNSTQVLNPGAPPVFKVSEVPGKPKNLDALQKTADSLFGQAEQKMNEHLPEPVAETPAAPVEAAPAEAPPTPQEAQQTAPAPAEGQPVTPPAEAAPAAPEAAYTGPERRQPENVTQRKKVEEMTPEEMKKELLTDYLTGLGNKRAWEETPRKAHTASIDADSLKWINDNYGHEAGDELLKAVGESLKHAGLGEDAFHVSGDEYYVHGDDRAQLEAKLKAAQEIVDNYPITFNDKDGVPHTVRGLGLSYGVGPDLTAAEKELGASKAEREKAGLRAGRGERPPRLAEIAASTGEAPREAAVSGEPAAAGRGAANPEEARPATEPAAARRPGRKRVAAGPESEQPAAPKRKPGVKRTAAPKAGAEAEKPAPAEAVSPIAKKAAPAALKTEVLEPGATVRIKSTGTVVKIMGAAGGKIGIRVMEPGEAKGLQVGEIQQVPADALAKSVELVAPPEVKPKKGFRSGAFYPGLSTKKPAKGTVATDPGVDEAFERSYVRPPAPPETQPFGVEKLLETGRLIFNAFTRQFVHLPETAEHAELKNLLTNYETRRAIANDQAIQFVEKELHGLSPDDHADLSKLFYVKDMEASLAHFQKQWVDDGHNLADFPAEQFLPEGITEQGVADAAKRMDAFLKANPKLNAIAIKVRTLRKEIVEPYKKDYAAVFGKAPALDEPWYLRHLVTFIEGEGEGGGPGGKRGGQVSRSVSPTMARKGTELDYRSHFAESEVDWVKQILQHHIEVQLIRHLAENYDIAAAQAIGDAALKDKDLVPLLDATAKTGTPLPALLDKLGPLAADEKLPDTLDGRHAETIAALHAIHSLNAERKANGQPPLPVPPIPGVAAYAKWLLSEREKHGRLKAALPKTHDWWDVTGRPSYYKALSVNERVVNEAIAQGLQQLNVPPDKVRKILAVGRRRQMLLPKDVIKTLDALKMAQPDQLDRLVNRAIKTLMGRTKWTLIYGPQNYVQQFIRNGTGDALRILRNAPGVVARVHEGKVRSAFVKALRDVVGNSVFLKPPSEALAAYDKHLGESALHYAAEELLPIHPFSPLSRFRVPRRLAADATLRQRIAHFANEQVSSPVKRFGSVPQWLYMLPHAVREKVGRVAVFYYIRDVQKEKGYTPVVGSAKAEQAMAIKDPDERAAFIADHIVGSYRQRTQGGRMLRRFVFPFFAFKEINRTGVYQELKNSLNAPDVAVALGRPLVGEGVLPEALAREATRAAALSRFLLGQAAGTLIMGALSAFLFYREYQELQELMPGQFPLITGHKDPKTGEIPMYRGMDPSRDLVDELFGVGAFFDDLKDLRNGRKSPGEVAIDMTVKNWANQLYQQFNPALKMKDIAGYSTFPSVFNARKVADPQEQFFDALTLGGAYRWLHAMPLKRGYVKKLLTGQNTVNPLELAYHDAQDNARDYLTSIGKPPKSVGGAAGDDPKATAMYWIKQAERLGDRNGAIHWLSVYGENKGSRKTLRQSMEALDPLADLPTLATTNPTAETRQTLNFLRTRKPTEAYRLRLAYLFYHNLVAPDADISGSEHLPLPQFVRFMQRRMKRAIERDQLLQSYPGGPELAQKLRLNEREARRRQPLAPAETGSEETGDELDKELGLTSSAP